jgi:hypothetical protein
MDEEADADAHLAEVMVRIPGAASRDFARLTES